MASQQCTRCGWIWDVHSTRNNHEICESCRARKVQKVGSCLAWHGRFAADMVTPIDEDGNEVMPGVRICGNTDCVTVSHVK